MINFFRFPVLASLGLAGILLVPGCATRKYVRNQTVPLEASIQEVSHTARESAERIDAVDRRAQQGITAVDQRATEANAAAQASQQAAQAADRKADTANQGVLQANSRIDTLEARISRLNDNYTAEQTRTITFLFDSSTLSKEAMATLDRIAAETSQRAGYMVEVKGFTDSIGTDTYNLGLSQRRAQSVLRYLSDKNVPLFRISIVGLGETKPVADNTTRTGRDQNRRVEVTVLRTATASGNN